MGKMKQQFNVLVENFEGKAEAELTKRLRRFTREALRRIVERSPVWTGAYVKSHRVGIKKSKTGRGFSGTHEPVVFAPPGGPYPKRMSEAQANALRKQIYNKLKSRISRVEIGDTVAIFNNIPYADRVEFIGWPPPEWTGMSPGPYHVYSLTKAEMRHFK